MNTRLQHKRWAESDPESSPNPSPLPVRTTFRHMEPSPAVTARITAEAQKLLRYFDRISHCRAVVFAPHRHHRRGRRYAIHLELGVPGDVIVITHEPPAPLRGAALRAGKRSEPQASPKDIYAVIRKVFDSARRRLEDHARRVRGDVKHHEPAQAGPEANPAATR